jgi:alpha-tubulin suppressor-like RCC1 family protein
VAAGGALWCWGASSFGQLGIDPRDAGTCEGVACKGVPHEVPGITGARSVAAGGDQTCALLEDGRVRCFGANQFGQLGRGTADTLDHATPATVELDAIDTVSVGRFHACALSYDGTVRCWGLALDGRVGSDTSALETCVADESIAWAIDVPAGTTVPCATRPVLVPEISDATELAVGADHACAVRTGGEVVCWGRGAEGQLGHDRSPESSAVPVTVSA